MNQRLLAMLKKEFIQLFRDPRMRAVVIIVPVLQSLIFGYAVNMDIKQVIMAFEDMDQSSYSNKVLVAFQGSPYFSVDYFPKDEKESATLLEKGKIMMALRIKKGFARQISRGSMGDIQVQVDGTDSNQAALILSYVQKIAQSFSPTKSDLLTLENRIWFNQNQESRVFYMPGVIALMATIITLLLSSMSIVREKEMGTIEQLMVTPISKTQFILGKTLPYSLVGLFDITLIYLLATRWFNIPFLGDLWVLYLGTVLFLLSTLGAGLYISTISNTQQQAMMSCFLVIFPFTLLSGYAFPVENMTKSIQYLTYINPLCYYLVIIRSVFLKGLDFCALKEQFMALGILGFITLSMAVIRFRKTVS